MISLENVSRFIDQPWISHGLAPMLIFITVFFCVLFFKGKLWRFLKRHSEANEAPWIADLLKQMKHPTYLFILLAALASSLQVAPQSVRDIPALLIGLKLGLVIALVLVVDRGFLIFLNYASARRSLSRSTRSLLILVVRAIFYSVMGLIVLDMMGVSITPLLASLGIGSIAVALALQDTLANFFSGLYLLIDRPFSLGDYVKIDENSEGYVVKIGWRSTQVRKLDNNVIVIPNSKVSSGIILNYYSPEKEMAVLVQMGVSYASDLKKVEEVTIAAATQIQKQIAGAVADFSPFIRYHTFADSSINFTVILRAKEFTDHFLIKHEFIKLLHERYAQEGIEIPFPQRTVHVMNAASAELSHVSETHSFRGQDRAS